MNPEDLRTALRTLSRERRERHKVERVARPRRRRLKTEERKAVLRKADGRCHLCGGAIQKGEAWQADHVLAHSAGGPHSIDNYLPAHTLCNNYRWDYSPDEFQWILKLGVWLRTQIERQTTVGRAAGVAFCAYEARRVGRRRAGGARMV